MIVNEWIEPYTLMMGVHSMGVITEILCSSGLVYAPFFVAIVKSIVEAMTQGVDEGNAGEVSIHRNSIDTGKMRRSSLDPTFLLA
ncbi:hypothetical protein, partial [Aeromonas hydrophila]